MGIRTFLIKKFRPDVIHAHLPFGVGIEGLIAAKILRVPLVGTDHTPMGEFIRYSPLKNPWIEKVVTRYNAWFYRRCNFVTSPAQAVLDELREHFDFKVPSRPLSNPLDLLAYKPLRNKKSLKKKFGLSSFTLMYAGRLAPEKNIHVAIRAVALLVKKIPEITLAIVGQGPAKVELETLADSLGIRAHIKFLGFLPTNEALAEAYNASEIFVMMSTAETQSLVMVNAMACGVPAIGARAWGLKEYITPKNGILIKPGSVEELAENIFSLYQKPATRTKLGRGAKESVKNFSIGAIAKEWEMIYRKTVNDYNQKNK